MRAITSITDSSLSPYSLHVNLNQTQDFANPAGPAHAVAVGLGFTSPGVSAGRYVADMTFNSQSTWHSLTECVYACGIHCSDENIPLSNVDAILMNAVPRAGGSPPTPTFGDSGSPLIITATNFPEIGSGQAQLGVMSQADSISTAEYAPTFDGNGVWLEQALSELTTDAGAGDGDGDGVANNLDNCPVVPNKDQADSNYDAELVVNLPSSPFPNEGLPPNSSSTQAYADHWHAAYPGDACDTVPTTPLTPQDAPNGHMGPCLDLSEPSGQLIAVSGSCPETVTTGLRADSYIGNPLGAAPSVNGQSAPAFCPCTDAFSGAHVANTICGSSQLFHSPVASDASFPPTQGHALGTGWYGLTSYRAPGGTIFFPPYSGFAPFPSTFQEKTDLLVSTGAFVARPQTRTWSFTDDLARMSIDPNTTDLLGVSWGHVTGFGAAQGGGFSPPPASLPNSYAAVEPQVHFGGGIIHIPVGGPAWSIFGWAPDPWGGQIPWFAVVRTTSGDPAVYQNSNNRETIVTSSFSADALALMGEIAAGQADLIVGDDVAVGRSAFPKFVTAVVVTHGTTDLVGGLLSTRSGVTAPDLRGVVSNAVATQKTSRVAVPPLLRSFSSATNTLASISKAPDGFVLTLQQATVDAVPVTLPILGQPPEAPVAMVWDFIANRYDVIDVVSEGLDKARLRMLIIGTDGTSREIWRTEAVPKQSGGHDRDDDAWDRDHCGRGVEHPSRIPEQIALSLTSTGDVLLTLGREETTEIVTFTTSGVPVRSATVSRKLLSAAYGASDGVTLPSAQPPTATQATLRTTLLPWSEMSEGACSAAWLSNHVDQNGSSLATSINQCARWQHRSYPWNR